MSNKLTLSLFVLLAAMISGCEQDGPAERAGESVDNAAERVQEAGKDLGNSIEDACEDAKAGVGAKDTDC